MTTHIPRICAVSRAGDLYARRVGRPTIREPRERITVTVDSLTTELFVTCKLHRHYHDSVIDTAVFLV